jgi:hypothetical protein
MASSLRFLAVLIFGVAAIAADSPTTRPISAVAKYKEAVVAADRIREKSVDRAREILVKELKAAEKTAMQQGDLTTANAIEEILKSNNGAVPTPLPEKGPKSAVPPFVGATLKLKSGGTMTLRDDGSIASSVDGPGHWKLISDKSILVTFDDHRDWVRIFNFDESGKVFKSTSFQQRESDTGSSVR